MHCAGQHKPYAEWHKPCRYYRLLFRNLQAPPQIPATVFCDFPPVLTTTLPALLPMAYAADFRGRFSTTLIAVPSAFCCWLPLLFPSADPSRLRRRPIGISDILCFGLFTKSYHRTLRRFLRCEIFAGSRCRFLRCGPLSGTAAEIFTGSLGATRVLWKLPAGGCPTFGAPVFSICYRWCRSIPKPHF